MNSNYPSLTLTVPHNHRSNQPQSSQPPYLDFTPTESYFNPGQSNPTSASTHRTVVPVVLVKDGKSTDSKGSSFTTLPAPTQHQSKAAKTLYPQPMYTQPPDGSFTPHPHNNNNISESEKTRLGIYYNSQCLTANNAYQAANSSTSYTSHNIGKEEISGSPSDVYRPISAAHGADLESSIPVYQFNNQSAQFGAEGVASFGPVPSINSYNSYHHAQAVNGPFQPNAYDYPNYNQHYQNQHYAQWW